MRSLLSRMFATMSVLCLAYLLIHVQVMVPSLSRSPVIWPPVSNRPLLPSSLLLFSRVYLDFRDDHSRPVLRGVAFKRCSSSQNLFVWFVFKSKQVVVEPLKLISLNHGCPFPRSPQCTWGPFFVKAALPVRNLKAVSMIERVYLSDSSQKLSTAKSVKLRHLVLAGSRTAKYQHTLALCVSPLYLYADWLQLMQFAELWRQLGASKIWIYETSVSGAVDKWLTALVDDGLVERVPWPMFPTNGTLDPNERVYRMGQVGAIHECLLRAVGVAEFVGVVDTDEFMLPDSGLLINWLRQKTRDPTVGAIIFHHDLLEYPSDYSLPESISLDHFNFGYMGNMNRKRPGRGNPKMIFRPERAVMATVHRLRSLMSGFHKRTLFSGKLYHLRRTIPGKRQNDSVQNFSRFQPFLPQMNANFHRLRRKCFGAVRELDSGRGAMKAVTGCVDTWRQFGCKAPHLQCAHLLHNTSFLWNIHDHNSSNYIDNFLVV